MELAEETSVWFTAVLRGDVNFIRVGRGTNIQDGTIVHVNRGGTPSILEEFVTVGHAARLHGCHIKSHCLIGIGAIILGGADIGEGCIVAAGSVVKENAQVPPRSLVAGVPARVLRPVTDAELVELRGHADHYWELARTHVRS